MKFVAKDGKALSGTFTYIHADRAFDFTPKEESVNDEPAAALVISHTLQIDVRLSDGKLLYVWGYCPREAWVKKLQPFGEISMAQGEVFLDDTRDMSAGLGYHADLAKEPIVAYSDDTFTIGDYTKPQTFTEFASGCIIGIYEGKIISFILRTAPAPEVHGVRTAEELMSKVKEYYDVVIDTESKDTQTSFITVNCKDMSPIIIKYIGNEICSVEFVNNQFYEIPQEDLLSVVFSILAGDYEIHKPKLFSAPSIKIEKANSLCIIPARLAKTWGRKKLLEIYADLPTAFRRKTEALTESNLSSL